MRTRTETSRSLSLASLALLAFVGFMTASLSAAGPPPLPPGMGKYVMVLWPPGTPVPGREGPGPKNDEPDVEKMGGRVLYQRDNRRIIHLPVAAAKQLWRHQSVVYLQRIWSGESLEGWDEGYSGDDSRTGPKIATDDHLQWGPRSYSYDGSGNIKQIGPDAYVYDTAGRLVEATVSGKTQRFKYDAFGNLVETAVAGANAVPIPVDGSSNRLLGRTYDTAGNVVVDEQQRPYQFDSLNMLTRVGDRRMIYDAADERIGTLIGWSLARWTIRDFDGQIIREYKGENQIGVGGLDWYWEQDHIRGAGQLLAGETQQWKPPHSPPSTQIVYGGARHYHLDHLGSVRMVTDSEGRSISEHDYLPFGTTLTRTYQEEYNWGDPHIDGMRFAGHWRDFLGHLNVENHDYLDYMHARYYDPSKGRFLSVDPAQNWKKAMAAPQAWNRYAYARNNPLRLVDPDGRDDMDFRILTARVNVIYSNADGKINSRGETLRQVTEQGITYSRAFFVEAGIKLQVNRFEGTINTQALGNINGPVNTGTGPVELSSFIKSQPGALTVLVSGDLAGITGKTVGVGGPTMIGNASNSRTFNDEIAHALGNVTAVNVPLVSNAVADIRLDIQEYSVDKGWGLGRWFQDTFRENLDKLNK